MWPPPTFPTCEAGSDVPSPASLSKEIRRPAVTRDERSPHTKRSADRRRNRKAIVGTGELMQHISVMLDRCIDLLSPAISASDNPVVIDATLGLGGHTEALLNLHKDLTVIGIDRDTQALDKAQHRLEKFGSRVKTAHACFDEITEVANSFGFTHINGALFDLGVSSMQLDDAEQIGRAHV